MNAASRPTSLLSSPSSASAAPQHEAAFLNTPKLSAIPEPAVVTPPAWDGRLPDVMRSTSPIDLKSPARPHGK